MHKHARTHTHTYANIKHKVLLLPPLNPTHSTTLYTQLCGTGGGGIGTFMHILHIHAQKFTHNTYTDLVNFSV